MVANICRVLQNIKAGIEGKAVSWYSDVFDVVFKDLDRERANGLWKKELAKPEKGKEGRSDEADDVD